MGCQDASDPALTLKATGILSDQSMQGQTQGNIFKKAYDGPKSSVLMVMGYIHAETNPMNVLLQALQVHELATI